MAFESEPNNSKPETPAFTPNVAHMRNYLDAYLREHPADDPEHTPEMQELLDGYVKNRLKDPKFRTQVRNWADEAESEASRSERSTFETQFALKRNEAVKLIDPTLSVGLVQGAYSRSGDSVGIYRGTQYLGAISGDVDLRRMTCAEIYIKTFELLGRPLEVSVVVAPEAETLMQTQGVAVDRKTQTLKLERERNPKLKSLPLNGTENENWGITITKKDESTLILSIGEKEGDYISYEIKDGQLDIRSRKVTDDFPQR